MTKAQASSPLGGDNYFTHTTPSGEMYSFFISDEDASVINVEAVKNYTEDVRKLTDAARDVLNDRMFGDVNVRDLAVQYAFRPFPFQFENVERMLNRFRGRGVFGDQVGLGKTVEALMTAHAMFASGAIRNALIIVNKNILPGWIETILLKFPGIFKIHVAPSCEAIEIAHASKLKDVAERHPDIIEVVRPLEGEDARKNNIKEFLALVARIQKDKQSSPSGTERFPLYFVTNTMFKASELELLSMTTEQEREQLLLEGARREQRGDVDTFINRLRSKDVFGSTAEFAGVFKEDPCLGGQPFDAVLAQAQVADSTFALSQSGALRYLLKKLKEVLSVYRATPVGDSRVFDVNRRNTNVKCLEEKVQPLEKIVSSMDKELADIRTHASLFSDTRAVDLLVVDEIHSFFRTEGEEGQEMLEQGLVDPMVSYLATMPKKFCVLISATPVRTRLDDVFQLLFMANPKLFLYESNLGGNLAKEARQYFYGTMCRIGEGKNGKAMPFPLAEMVLDGEDISDDKLKVFLGLINGFFTRRRIQDVNGEMLGISCIPYGKLGAEQKSILTALEESIVQKRARFYAQAGLPKAPEVLRKKAEAELAAWKSTDEVSFARLFEAEAKADGVTQEQKLRHFLSAVDAALIEVIDIVDMLHLRDYRREGLCLESVDAALLECVARTFRAFCSSQGVSMREGMTAAAVVEGMLRDLDLLRCFKRELYAMVNWSRRKKRGIAFVPSPSTEPQLEDGFDRYKLLTQTVLQSLEKAVTKLRFLPSGEGVVTVPTDKGTFILDSEQPAQTLENVFCSMLYDTAMVYLSRTADDAREGAMAAFREESQRLLSPNNAYFSDERAVDLEGKLHGRMHALTVSGDAASTRANAVAFVNASYKAGVNLQQYRSFVFLQMDDSRTVLAPADIEQWVGRIYRTGQVKNCRILTVIKNLSQATYSADFLKWYYCRVLSDPQGLDLYGNGTPDVAFIQPIVADCVRKKLLAMEMATSSKLQTAGFVQLANLCFINGTETQQYLIRCVRELCKRPGFGKPGTRGAV